jgi:predicted O-methyltransferase YrrM
MNNKQNAVEIYNAIIKYYTLQQVKSEWITFIDFLIELQPKIIVEIGTYAGGSAFTFAHFAELIISIDDNDKFRKRQQIRELSKLIFINKTSKKNSVMLAVETQLADRNTLADLLFIDGEHTYKGAKRDFNSYKKFVKPGGYIVLHDILESPYHIQQHCLVHKFWHELKIEYPDYKEIFSPNQKWGGIGIIKV